MDSPARGDCSGQKAWIWDSKNGFPRQGRLLPDKKLGFGTPKMDSPGRGACSRHKNLDLGLQKWIPPVGAPASGHKNMYWERPVANLGYPWFLDTFPVFKNFLAPVAFQDPWFLVEISCGTTTRGEPTLRSQALGHLCRVAGPTVQGDLSLATHQSPYLK